MSVDQFFQSTAAGPVEYLHDGKFSGHAVIELMGHRKTGGYVTEEMHFGVTMLRIDIPKVSPIPPAEAFERLMEYGFVEKHQKVTQYYMASAIYCVTPCDERTAFVAAVNNEFNLVSPYEAGHAVDLLKAWETGRRVRRESGFPAPSNEDAEDDGDQEGNSYDPTIPDLQF